MSPEITKISMLENRSGARAHPSLREALGFWWKLGWITFGGTAAHLAIMQSELVEKRRWIDSDHFFHALSHCMLLPGPEAQQLATYLAFIARPVGWRLKLQDSGKGEHSGCGCGFRLRTNAENSVMTSPIGKG
jgi:hypothetical protein